MKTFVGLVALCLLVTVAAQTFRHVYVRWVEPRGSELDRFREKTEKEIAESRSLDELVLLYGDAHTKVKEAEKTRADDTRDYERLQKEPYKSEDQLKRAIKLWEEHRQEIIELQFFWWCGLACLVVGVLATKPAAWLGASFLLLGVLEMIWATWPALRTFGAEPEFDRLLAYKVYYSSATLFLSIVISCVVLRRFAKLSASAR